MKNLKPHILIISPKFHPLEDGLGQYTKQLYLNLKNHAKVSVATSSGSEKPLDREEFNNVFDTMDGWKFPKLFKLQEIIKQLGPDILLFQYVPFMYAQRGGVNFSIVFLMLYMRVFSCKKIHIMYHELHYPLQLNIKAVIMFCCHILMLLISGISSHRIFASTSFFTKRLSRVFLGLKKEIHLLPVGSNITLNSRTPLEQEELRSLYAKKDEILLGCFGSFHPSKNYPLILNTLAKVKLGANLKIKLLFIGAEKRDLLLLAKKQYRPILDEIIKGTGFLENDSVGMHLEILDGFIGYFIDGISTRRGSLIAALASGVPVLSTLTKKTDSVFLDQIFVKLLSPSPLDFSAQLEQSLLEGWPGGDLKKEVIESFYKNNFDWHIIIKKYISHI